MSQHDGFPHFTLTTARIAVITFFCLVPGLALLLGGTISLLYAQFLLFAVAAVSIAVWTMWKGQNLAGGAALLIVLALLRIKITAGSQALQIADVGISVWAVGGALCLVALGVFLSTRAVRTHRAHLLFAAFIVWGVVLIPFQPGPRPIISLLTAALFIWPLTISIAVLTLRRYGLSRTVGARVLVAAVAGHLFIAVGQIINQGQLGLWLLGEAEGEPVGTLSLIGLTLPTGPYISGFTYRGPMPVLLTLTIPVMIVLGWQTRRHRGRVAYALLIIVSLVVLRLTRWDAGFLGTLTALTIFTVGVTAARRGRMGEFVTRGAVASIGAFVLGAGLVLLTLIHALLNPAPTAFNTQYLSVEQLVGKWGNLSLQFFSTANLEIRLQQYVLGLDLLLQYPLTGIGLTNFYYMSESLGLDQAYLMHNLFGQVFVGTGLIGGSIYIGAVLSAARSGIRSLLTAEDQMLVLALFAGLVGVHVQMMLNPQLIRFVSINAIWIVIALLIQQRSGQSGL